MKNLAPTDDIDSSKMESRPITLMDVIENLKNTYSDLIEVGISSDQMIKTFAGIPEINSVAEGGELKVIPPSSIAARLDSLIANCNSEIEEIHSNIQTMKSYIGNR